MRLSIGKKTAAIVVAVALLFGAGLLLYQNMYSNRAYSPTGEYYAVYNRFTKVLTVQQVGSDLKWLSKYESEPAFFWSDDGDQLAINYGNGAEINCISTSSSRNIPTMETINENLGDLKITNPDVLKAARITIAAVLDRNHVLVTFHCPSEMDYSIKGWFVFDHSAHLFKEFSAEKHL